MRLAVSAPWFAGGGALLLLCLSAAVAAAQGGAPRISLDDAIERALLADPSAVAAVEGVRTARADQLQARGAFLPAFSVGSAYQNSSSQRFDQATGQLVSESYTAELGASYEVFSGGRRLADARSTRAQVRAAEAALRDQEYRTALVTTERYYAAAAADELVGVARQRMDRAEQQRSVARTRLEVGNATRSDVLRAELELGNAEVALLDAEAALRTARLQLGRQVGADGEVQPAETTLPERAPALPPLETRIERALRTSPAAIAADAAAAQREAATWAAVSLYAPSIRASGGYNWLSFDFPPEQRSWNLRLGVTLPLFNGFQREAAVSRARAAERIADARARDARVGARVATEDAAREISTAERRVELSARAVELAREDLRVQEERYRIGNATILDLQTSQVALAEAEIAQVRARQTLAVAVARLEAVLGEKL
jgi:outer membrane protein